MQTEWSKKIVSLLEKTSAGGRYRSFEIFDDWLSICDATLQQLPSHMKNRSQHLPMVDTPETAELMAHKHSVEEIRQHIGVDSLAYISIDGLYQAVGEAKRNNDKPQYCDACFTGEYPVELVDKIAGCATPKVKARMGAKMLVSIDD